MEEIKIRSAKEMFKRTNESEAAFRRLVNNLMKEILEISDSGRFSLEINLGVEAVFRDRIISLLRDSGYEIDRRTYDGESNDGNWLIIKWGEGAIESED